MPMQFWRTMTIFTMILKTFSAFCLDGFLRTCATVSSFLEAHWNPSLFSTQQPGIEHPFFRISLPCKGGAMQRRRCISFPHKIDTAVEFIKNWLDHKHLALQLYLPVLIVWLFNLDITAYDKAALYLSPHVRLHYFIMNRSLSWVCLCFTVNKKRQVDINYTPLQLKNKESCLCTSSP